MAKKSGGFFSSWNPFSEKNKEEIKQYELQGERVTGKPGKAGLYPGHYINKDFKKEFKAYMAPRFNMEGKSPSFLPKDDLRNAVLGRRISADYDGMQNSPEIMAKNQYGEGVY